MSAIITLNDFKNYIGTEDINEERATQIIDGINSWVEAYTGRVWGETKTITDTLDFEPVVFLSHIDIKSVTSVKAFGQTLTQDNYKLNPTTGRLLLSRRAERKYSRDRFDQVEVVYSSGIDTIPADLKTAVLQLTAQNYNRRDDKDANVTSESLGSYSVSYGDSTGSVSESSSAGGSAGGNNSIMDVLNYYRLGRI